MVSIMSNNWNPFFALANTRGKIDEAFDNRNNVEKPVISEETAIEIQDKVVSSYENCAVVDIKYFKNSRCIVETGIVSKIDVINKTITINNAFLKFENIIEVI